MVKDPVCGMEISLGGAAAQEEYENETYYFCSSSCHDKFKVWPQYYLHEGADEQQHRGTGDGCCD